MNRLLLLLIYTMLPYLLTARQQMADSLLQEIAQAPKQSAKQAELYSRLSFSFIGTDTRKAIDYGRIAAAMAIKGGHHEQAAKAYICLSYAHEAAGALDEALLTIDSAAQYAIKANSYPCQLSSEQIKGYLYKRKARYELSLKHYMKALEMAEAHKDDDGIADACSNVAGYYSTRDDMERAVAYQLRALAILEQKGDSIEMLSAYENMGIFNRKKGDYEAALQYFNKAERLAHTFGNQSDIAYTLHDIGATLSFMNRTAEAETYLLKAVAIRESINERNELAYTYNYIGENYERKKDLPRAEAYIKKALAIAREIHNDKQLGEAYESLSDFYSRNAMYDSAYVYMRQFVSFRDSLAKLNNESTIAELTTKYETSKKEQKIKEQEWELKTNNYMLAGAGGLLLLGGLLGFSGYRRYRLKQQALLDREILKQKEYTTRAIIEAEENERQRIAGDLHDSVGQLMSAVKINLSSLQSDIPFADNGQSYMYQNALNLVDDACREIRVVSHNIMPNALLKKSLSDAISEFVRKIDNRVIKINLYTEGLNEHIDKSIEIVLYRVIQECVNNVIKHASATQLDICLIKEANEISITIEDNGKGFDFEAVNTTGGIGIRNIRTRLAYLKGTVEWSTTKGKGTAVIIHVPV